MNIVVEKQPKCLATLRVEIPADSVRSEREKIVNRYAGQAKVPGFRPGKAPRPIIEKRFEKQISEDLNEALINDAYDEALRKEALRVLDFGVPQDISTTPDGALSFVANLTLAPDFALPDYKNLVVKVPSVEVPDSEVDAQLAQLQQRFADFKDVEGRAAELEDLAVIDFTTTLDGKPLEEAVGKPVGFLGGREGHWVRLNDEIFLPGFANAMVGMNAGESREISLTLPEEFPLEVLRGKTVQVATSLKELKEILLPELNDELAEKLAPGKTMDEIREILKGNMRAERQRQLDDLKVQQIVDQLTTAADFELPENLVARETQNQVDKIVEQGVEQGVEDEEIENRQQEIFANAAGTAVHNLKSNFILQEIARVENLAVSDAELVNHLAAVAQSRKVSPKKFIKDLSRAGRLPSIRNSILVGKAIDFLVSNATVEESSEALPEA